MGKKQLMEILGRLRKPSTILSLISHVVSILLLLGVHMDQGYIMTIAAATCSLFVTMGILNNPDTENKGFGDDILICTKEEVPHKHVMVNGEMVCCNCGAVYDPMA